MALALLEIPGCVGCVARPVEHLGRSYQKTLVPFRQVLEQAGSCCDAMQTGQGTRIAYRYGLPHDYGVKLQISEQRAGGHVALHADFHFKALSHAARLSPRAASCCGIHGAPKLA